MSGLRRTPLSLRTGGLSRRSTVHPVRRGAASLDLNLPGEALQDEFVGTRRDVDPDPLSLQLLGSHAGRGAPAEWVEHYVARVA